MNPTVVAGILVGLVAFATVLGLVWRAQQGRIRHTDGRTVVKAAEIPGIRRLASGATLLQFSTEICAPCKVTHTVLDGIAHERTNVSHIDLDVTHRPDIASRFHILQTPTTLILDRKGIVRARIGGAPRVDELRVELDRILLAA
ncbi:MAG: thioredoxin [Salinibacterium sp.]|nr:MAG: thioredoxin [Salinibacterium sp.]